MSSKIRTFVAVDVSPGVRQAIQREIPRLQAAEPSWNWTKVQNYHFTLSFLGDVLDRELPEICESFRKSVASIEEFELEIVGLRPFPSIDRVRYVWAEVGYGKKELCDLQSAVADAANQLGFPRDREIYTPHLTVARAGRGPARHDLNENLLAVLEPLQDHSFGVSSVDEVIVYSSLLEKQGPTYVPMSTISLS
jgi:2'-5' RNA ligase